MPACKYAYQVSMHAPIHICMRVYRQIGIKYESYTHTQTHTHTHTRIIIHKLFV